MNHTHVSLATGERDVVVAREDVLAESTVGVFSYMLVASSYVGHTIVKKKACVIVR